MHRLDRAFVIIYFNFVWGHWLIEMYPKLFVIRVLNVAGIIVLLLLFWIVFGYVVCIVRMMLFD